MSGSPASLQDRWPARIQSACEGLGVSSVYQPIVDLSRQIVVGFEALTRFTSDDGGPVDGPYEWFQNAHRLGTTAALDAAALRSALSARADLPPNCFLTVNVEPESLLDSTVNAEFASTGDLAGIVIEITEHRSWDWHSLAPVVRRLRANGALFAVDDAGAGYAGLQQMLDLRPEFLKIDRSLITAIDRDEAKRALVAMLGRFANQVDAWVLAEGVETVEEARTLSELEIPLAQGFAYARPAAPWAGITPVLSDDLLLATDVKQLTLHALTEPLPAAADTADLAKAWSARDEDWIAVTTGDLRPVGLVNADAALRGELVPGLRANVNSSPQELAHRIATSSVGAATPVLVTDNAGRYCGVVRLRRLLRHLAEQPQTWSLDASALVPGG